MTIICIAIICIAIICIAIICIAIIDNINTCGNGGAYASARDTGIE